MHPHISPGARFRKALELEQPLQIVGAINALHALMAKNVGYRAIYLSGGGLAAGSLGMPDLGLNTLDDVLTDVRRITDVCDLPLLVDADTGFGPSALNIARSVKALIKAGAAAMHIEDQVGAKRCGHRPNKEVVSDQEMVDRIRAAVDARTDSNFFIMARTDALATLGLEAAIGRAQACLAAGADGIFAEGVDNLNTYQRFTENLQAPVLANLTEFGLTPTLNLAQLQRAGIAMALYPLTIFRVANLAALRAYQDLRREGSQKKLIPHMQTRTELYDTIDYHKYEMQLDKLLAQSKAP